MSTTTTGAGILGALDAAYARGWIPGDNAKQVPTFPSGMTREAGKALADLVRAEGACQTLETGLALGLSTLWILWGSAGHAAGVSHTAVDPYQKKDWKNSGLRLLREAGVREMVEFVEEDSALALPRLVREGRRCDLVFVDGGHLFENAFTDILFASRLVRPGGLVVVDDLWMPAVRTAIAYFESNVGLSKETPASEAARRFALLRVPERLPERRWDHFVPFAPSAP
jgi:predicted O-methyltransferase YrrM